MLSRLCDIAIRRRKTVLVVSLLVFLFAGAVGGSVASHLSTGGFDDPSSESGRVATALKETFGQGSPEVVLVVTAEQGVDDPAAAAAGQRLTARLAGEDKLYNVVSYWSLGSPPPLKS